MTITGQDAESQGTAADGEYPGYCSEHAAAAGKYGWSYTPNMFVGCPQCDKPDGFDLKSQYHLAAAAAAKEE